MLEPVLHVRVRREDEPVDLLRLLVHSDADQVRNGRAVGEVRGFRGHLPGELADAYVRRDLSKSDGGNRPAIALKWPSINC